MDEHRTVNRAHSDEATDVHIASDFYDVASFKARTNRLHGIKRAERGDKARKP